MAENSGLSRTNNSRIVLKNFSQAAHNNKDAILGVLKRFFLEPGLLLEIGSGSGQHAIHMAGQMRSITWQPTEMSTNLPALEENLLVGSQTNVLKPAELEIGFVWPEGDYRYAYAANVLHIMSERLLPDLFSGLRSCMCLVGLVCFYGPFKYGGEFTTESNARFDGWLKRNYPKAGIRDIEIVEAEAASKGFKLSDDFAMPANNQLLVFVTDNDLAS